MWLRALVGAYAGQVRDFRTDVGLQALRSGTAERVESPAPALTPRATGDGLALQPQNAAIAPIAEKVRTRKKK